jgi:hypothetical protein
MLCLLSTFRSHYQSPMRSSCLGSVPRCVLDARPSWVRSSRRHCPQGPASPNAKQPVVLSESEWQLHHHLPPAMSKPNVCLSSLDTLSGPFSFRRFMGDRAPAMHNRAGSNPLPWKTARGPFACNTAPLPCAARTAGGAASKTQRRCRQMHAQHADGPEPGMVVHDSNRSTTPRRAAALGQPPSHLRVLRASACICVKPLLASPRAAHCCDGARLLRASQHPMHLSRPTFRHDIQGAAIPGARKFDTLTAPPVMPTKSLPRAKAAVGIHGFPARTKKSRGC